MRKLFIVLLALLAAAPAALAQERRAYAQAELEQMLAPIALYPDSLLSQVLMASTYPLDVVEAARWSRATRACSAACVTAMPVAKVTRLPPVRKE